MCSDYDALGLTPSNPAPYVTQTELRIEALRSLLNVLDEQRKRTQTELDNRALYVL